jgi:hypothetical protein
MKRRRVWMLAALGVVAAFFAVGCSGGSEEQGSGQGGGPTATIVSDPGLYT